MPNNILDNCICLSCSVLMLFPWMLNANACAFLVLGPHRAVCSTYIRREVGLGNGCSHKNSLHGYPGKMDFSWFTDFFFFIWWKKSWLFCYRKFHFFTILSMVSKRRAKLQDIARLTLIALRNEKINGKLLTFAGPRAWTTQEVRKNISTFFKGQKNSLNVFCQSLILDTFHLLLELDKTRSVHFIYSNCC